MVNKCAIILFCFICILHQGWSRKGELMKNNFINIIHNTKYAYVNTKHIKAKLN
jgi:hypothetical protein